LQIDVSKNLIDWIRVEKYGLLDMNLYPKPVEKYNTRGNKNMDESSKEVLTYLWDNFIQCVISLSAFA